MEFDVDPISSDEGDNNTNSAQLEDISDAELVPTTPQKDENAHSSKARARSGVNKGRYAVNMAEERRRRRRSSPSGSEFSAVSEGGELAKSSGHSMEEGEVAEEEVEEVEDVDEDELYLRLIALRSLAPELDDEKLQKQVAADVSKEGANAMVEEMEELLEEAEQAAEGVEVPKEGVKPTQVVVLADSDEEKMDRFIKSVSDKKETPKEEPNMTYLMQKLRKSLARQKQEEDVGKRKTEGVQYSPTQSPIYSATPHSPDTDCSVGGSTPRIPGSPEVISLMSPCSSVEEIALDIALPSGNHPGANNVIVIDDDDDDEMIRFTEPPRSPSIDAEPVDMELGSENEAEIQFFKAQKKLDFPPPSQIHTKLDERLLDFPSSVWNFNSNKNASNLDRFFSSDREGYEAAQNERDLHTMDTPQPPPPRRKRKLSTSKRRRTISHEVVTLEDSSSSADSSEDDDEVLRKQLLQAMALKQDAKRKKLQEEELKIPTPVIEKTPEAAPVTKENISVQAAIPQPSKVMLKVKPFALIKEVEKVQTKSPTPPPPPLLPPTYAWNPDLEKLKSRNVLMVHFPNLYKKVLITKEDLAEPVKKAKAPPSTPMADGFGASLDLLLKEGRDQTVPKGKEKAVPPPKPIRKHPPPKRKAVSLAAKAKLMTTSVHNLPLEMQAEYKRLKALIAKKEKLGRLPKKPVVTAVPTPPAAKPEGKRSETPDEMRERLLEKIKSRAQSVPKSGDSKSKEKKSPLPSPKKSSQVASLKVSVHSGGRNVKVSKENGVQMEGLKETDQKAIGNLEKDVVAKRSEVISELFKLSAQLSTLNDENQKRKAAQLFADKLRAELSELEKTLEKKDERISQLRLSVRASHQTITKRRTSLQAAEGECRALGEKLARGEGSYQLPQDHNATMKQKLASIASNAKQMKTTTEASKNSPSSSSSSSSLAHLQASKQPGSLDPHTELCRFQLQGKCNDDLCPYQHI